MILGIGIDIVQIQRIVKSINRMGDRLAKRILHTEEWIIYQKKSYNIVDITTKNRKKALFIAKHFAAKEALVKALGVGMRFELSWQDIQIIRDSLGKPSFILYGKTHQLTKQKSISRIHLSLSDEQQSAIALVILER